MIREATHSDIPALVAMGKTFTDKAGFADHVGYCPESVAALLGNMLDGGHVLLIGDKCMAGALVVPHPFNHAHTTAQELFWWSEGREGVRLFEALEAAVKARGAQSLVMVTIEAINPDAAVKFYQRRGYRQIERNFMKVF